MYDSKLKKFWEENRDSHLQWWLGWWSQPPSLFFCTNDKELTSCPVLQTVHQSECSIHELTGETSESSDSDTMHSYRLGLYPKTTLQILKNRRLTQSRQNELQCCKSLLDTKMMTNDSGVLCYQWIALQANSGNEHIFGGIFDWLFPVQKVIYIFIYIL